jgi:hypothetical protein
MPDGFRTGGFGERRADGAPSLRSQGTQQPIPTLDRPGGSDEAVKPMPGAEDREFEALDREISRKGNLIALIACLAIAAGLALAAILSMTADGF